MKIKTSALMSVLLVVLLDMIGIGLVIPLLSPILLETNTFLGPADDFAYRSMILGFLIAIYSFAQFLGSPIFGSLSDKYGRKPVMLWSLWGRFGGYLLMVAGMMMASLELLFIGRFITGFTGGNISVAMSAISDVSTKETKSANFGYVGVAFAIGLVLGPFLGGILSDSSLVPWFNETTPFITTALLSLINILVLQKYFQETWTRLDKGTKIDLFMSFRNIATAFTIPKLWVMFLVVFMICVGYGFFTEFYQVTLIEKYHFDAQDIGWTFAYVGIWIAITQGIINRWLSRIWAPAKILSYVLVLSSVCFALLLVPEQSIYIYFILPFVALFLGLTEPNYNALISNSVSADIQGRILGVTQSVQSLAFGIPPVIAGVVAGVDLNLPLELAAGISFLAWAVFMAFYYLKKKKATAKSTA